MDGSGNAGVSLSNQPKLQRMVERLASAVQYNGELQVRYHHKLNALEAQPSATTHDGGVKNPPQADYISHIDKLIGELNLINSRHESNIKHLSSLI